MELILEVVSAERFMLGDNACHRFLPAGGVIGRSSGCDWMIPDQARHLSGRHAIISYDAGQFYVTDISTNGTFLNDNEALPKNVAVVLQDEDRLTMGEHQFRVRIETSFSSRAHRSLPQTPVSAQAAIASTTGNPMARVDAFMADRQRQAPPQHRPVSLPDQLRPEQEAFVPPRVMPPASQVPPSAPIPDDQLPDNWMDLSVVGASEPPSGTLFDTPAPPSSVQIPRPGSRTPPSAAPRPHEPSLTTHAPWLTAFAEGLGVRAEDIMQAGGEAFMMRAGALLRQCLQGLVSNAQTRASLKNEFRLDMTLVNPRANNPVKFSAHGDQLVRQLFSGERESFLTMEEAVAECSEDFRHHQLAMMAGMQQAFKELMQQLSPDELEQRFERMRQKGLRLTGKGNRYWEAYREFHQELQEEDDIFASLFMVPFARAYDEQIRKLRQDKKEGSK